MIDTIVDSTARCIMAYADIDLKIIERVNDRYSGQHVVITDADKLEDYILIADYIKQNNWDDCYYTFYQARINDFITKCITVLPKSISVSQLTINPYCFYFTIEDTTFIFPLLITRALLHLLRNFHIRVTCEKYPKNMTDPVKAYLMDICFRGKSEIKNTTFAIVAQQAKKIRYTLNPWLTEEESTAPEEKGVNEASARFSGAPWFEAVKKDVTLIGAGGLGSNISVSLCRVLGNAYLTIYDADNIEYRNLAGQNFGITDIGRAKASVVAEQCSNFNPLIHTSTINNMFSADYDLSDNIVITGLDNMATRSLVYSKWKQNVDGVMDVNKSNFLLLDARLSAETWQIFCIKGDDIKVQEEYENKWLFSDDEADEGVCSYKQTAFAAQMCASFVTNLYINYCFNQTLASDDPHMRYLPFMTEYDASQMLIRYQDID